ncbi:MAG: lmo0937 family membrane protein [Terracidiphilus sp.]
MNALGAPEPGFPSQAYTMQRGVLNMLWAIFVVVLVLWLLGFSFHIAGSMIHLLLVVALIILVFNLISGRRRVL